MGNIAYCDREVYFVEWKDVLGGRWRIEAKSEVVRKR